MNDFRYVIVREREKETKTQCRWTNRMRERERSREKRALNTFVSCIIKLEKCVTSTKNGTTFHNIKFQWILFYFSPMYIYILISLPPAVKYHHSVALNIHLEPYLFPLVKREKEQKSTKIKPYRKQNFAISFVASASRIIRSAETHIEIFAQTNL